MTSVEAAPHGREAILRQLYALFRTAGVEGVSIAQIAEKTGLGRSSLYHHFPGGKPEMVRAVLAHARAWLEQRVFAPLQQRAGPDGVETMLAALNELYDGGEQPCLLASLLLGGGAREVSEALAELLRAWLAAIAAALQGEGVAPARAEKLAQRALGQIEGGLILARGLGDRAVFQDALQDVRTLLLAA